MAEIEIREIESDELCYCNSGLTYEACCQPGDLAMAGKSIEQLQQATASVRNRLHSFADEYFEHSFMRQAWRDFMQDHARQYPALQPSHPFYQDWFLPWYWCDWLLLEESLDSDDKFEGGLDGQDDWLGIDQDFARLLGPNGPLPELEPIAYECFLSCHDEFSELELAVLLSAASAPFRFFEVESVDAGGCLCLRDLVFGARGFVTSREFAENIRPADVIYAKVFEMGGHYELFGKAPGVVSPAVIPVVRDTSLRFKSYLNSPNIRLPVALDQTMRSLCFRFLAAQQAH